MPWSVTTRITGFWPITAHLTSVIFIARPRFRAGLYRLWMMRPPALLRALLQELVDLPLDRGHGLGRGLLAGADLVVRGRVQLADVVELDRVHRRPRRLERLRVVGDVFPRLEVLGVLVAAQC